MEFGPVAGNYVVLSVVARMASLPGPLLESDHSAGHGRQPQLPSDQNAIVNWMIDQILGDPIAYFVPTNQIPRPISEPADESLSAHLELFLLCLLVLFQ
ncbi:MAG: hypothetical protein M3O95_12160 [Candidatus Dormibacteraeota bacterium]|nr:hypothetical protein [Candidatus Dormibacteraeota bacterium]